MMKLMTAEVVFDAIKKGDIKLTDEYRISENAWRRGGAPSGTSTMFAAINSKVSVDDLLHGAIIPSGNDACIALAEGIAGNEHTFATDFMTKRARELGMTKSTFGNSNGLPDPANKMTVRELAILARHIIQAYPDQYKLFGEKEFTWNKIRQQNRNPLLNALPGADGLKTGYTKEGGYGMVGSAVQNDTRLIVVVNGLEDLGRPCDRSQEDAGMGVPQLRDPGLDRGQPAGRLRPGVRRRRAARSSSSAPIRSRSWCRRTATTSCSRASIYNGPVKAPITAGQKIGVVRVWRGANVAMETPVPARPDAVGTGSTMRRALDGAQRARHRHVPRRRREALTWRKQQSNAPSLRGRFITFEGGEGSGKSTQIRKLAERLDAAKLRAIVTREPGGSPGAEIIRHLVLSGMGKLLGPEAETLLFAAARDDHVRTVILPALNQGIWVLCDRFFDSTRAYQGQLGQVSPDLVNADAARHHRRSQAGSDLHPRRAGRGRTATRRRAPRQRHGGPLRGGGRQVPPGFARRLPPDRGGRPGALRPDRRHRRSGYGRRHDMVRAARASARDVHGGQSRMSARKVEQESRGSAIRAKRPTCSGIARRKPPCSMPIAAGGFRTPG